MGTKVKGQNIKSLLEVCAEFAIKIRDYRPSQEGEEMSLVFCYGTLKKGHSNHRLLESQEFMGEAMTKPIYRLYDCGPYPCMILADEGKGVSVKGEVYRVDEKTLKVLDRLEGVPHLYKREQIKLLDNADFVLGYLYQRDFSRFLNCGQCWPSE